MNEKEKKNGKTIALATHRAMLELPEDAIEIIINAKIYADGKIQEVNTTLSMKDIREAFRKADEGYIDEDDTFMLAEAGKEWLDKRDMI